MRREEFLKQLEQLLMDISEEERKEALRFYESYFEDAGEANEEKILKELESPQKVADTIKKELGENAGSSDANHNTDDSDAVNREHAYGSKDVFQKKNSIKSENKQKEYTSFHSNGKFHRDSGYHEDESAQRNDGYDPYGNTQRNDSYDTYGSTQRNDSYDTYDSYGNPTFQPYEEADYAKEKKHGMPIWAKVLIIVAICIAGIILVLIIVAMVLGIGFAKNVTNKIVDNVTDKVFDNTMGDIDADDIIDMDDMDNSWFFWWNDTDSKDADTVYGEYDENAAVIDISMKGGVLVFERSDTDKITYEINGIKEDLEVVLDDNKFVLVDHRTHKKAVTEKGTVVVALPEMQFETVKIKNEAAVIRWEDFLQAKNVEISVDAGEISIEHIQADELLAVNIGTGYGIIEDADAGKLQIVCGTGEVNYEGLINGDAEITCGVGDVELEIEDQEKNFNYEIDCGIGCVEGESWSYTNLADECRIDNNADKTIKLDCGLGVIKLDFEDNGDTGTHHSETH